MRATLDVTNELIKAFQANPYRYLFESDLQADLLIRLRSRIAGELHVPRTEGDDPYRLGLIYSEYNGKIDIACLDPMALPDGLVKQHKGFDTYIYSLPVLIGIELKYRKMGDNLGFEACRRDRRKLRKLRDDGRVVHSLVLGFVQGVNDPDDFLRGVQESLRENVEDVTDLSPVYVISPNEIVAIHLSDN